QMRALEALHEGFGRNFGAALSGYLRTIIEVNVAHIEQLTYSEFIHSLPNPTCFNLLKADQLDGQLCLEISPLIIYPIIDRLLGGSNADLFIPQRPLTQIEQRLVQRITDRATHHLSEAWSNLTPITFKVEDFESNPQLVQIVPPNEVVVLISFELTLGEIRGMLNLCIPFNAIERNAGKLAANTWATYGRLSADQKTRSQVARRLDQSEVELVVTLAESTISTGDLLGLRVGDIITTDKDLHQPLDVEIAGAPKFHASPGAFKGRKAIEIQSPPTPPVH
ncbi:MAG TPA: flagellar motor switch protein FliM, partial [Pirellulaceae bacterium]|nr:flagellar motor switch protein FliM [Pirellulaceae bacterium]